MIFSVHALCPWGPKAGLTEISMTRTASDFASTLPQWTRQGIPLGQNWSAGALRVMELLLHIYLSWPSSFPSHPTSCPSLHSDLGHILFPWALDPSGLHAIPPACCWILDMKIPSRIWKEIPTDADRIAGAIVLPCKKQGLGAFSWGVRGCLLLLPTVPPTVLGAPKTAIPQPRLSEEEAHGSIRT